MKEPQRLLDLHADDAVGAAFRSANEDAPSPGAEAALLASLGVGAVLSTAPPALAAGGSALAKVGSVSALAKWLVGTVILVSAAVAVTAHVLSPAVVEAPNPAAVPSSSAFVQAPPPSPISLPSPALSAAPSASPPSVPVDSLPVAPPPASAVSQPAITTTRESVPEQIAAPPEPSAHVVTALPSLAPELAELDLARARLAQGRTQEALTMLDAYDKAFPNGVLSQEAEVIRIDALVRSRQYAAAEARGRAFLAQHPDSPQAPRVRTLLVQSEKNARP